MNWMVLLSFLSQMGAENKVMVSVVWFSLRLYIVVLIYYGL